MQGMSAPHANAPLTGLLLTGGGARAAYQVGVLEAVADIRLALNQTQPLGNSRFLDVIEQATGQRREPKPTTKRARILAALHDTEPRTPRQIAAGHVGKSPCGYWPA